MPGPTGQFYRLRIRNAANTADVLVVTSVRGGTNPYLVGPPSGDGASYNPLTGESMLGSYTVQIADWPTGGSPVQRVVTSQLEDASLKQQLAYRAAFIEMDTTGTFAAPTVLIAGILSLLKLVDAMTYEATIQDPMRAMDQSTLFSPSSALSMASWFTQWPYRGCLAGGPLMTPAGSGGVGPLGIRDLGGWEMKVESLSADQWNSRYYILRPRVVYGPPRWVANKKANLNDFAEDINQAAANYQTPTMDQANDAWLTISDAMTHGYCWAGLTWLIDTGAGPVPWKPYPFDQFVIIDEENRLHWNQSLISNFSGNWGIGAMDDGVKTLPIGATVKVRAVTVLPTDQCPLYLSGHPCDLLKQLWQSIPNLLFDQASLDAMKAAVGADMVMTFRITSAMKLTDLVNNIVRPLGLGIRGNKRGELELFDGRIFVGTTLPPVQIEAADVIDGTTSLPFELDPSLAAKSITFTQTRFTDQRKAPFINDPGIVDGVVVGTDALTITNADPGALPYGSLDWKTDGMISFKSGSTNNWQLYITTFATRIFDRFGRGGIGFETTLLRGGAGDALNLGDEAMIHLPQVPNNNYRLGDNPAVPARRMQITRRTVLPEGYAVRFDDSGPAAQPLAIVPVLTIAVAADAPRTVAVVTITNAAALNAAGYRVRVQWAMTTGAAPTADQWTDIAASDPGAVPSTVRLPPATTGTVISVRARSELSPHLPSSWSTPVAVALSGINPPTGLAVTPNATDGSLETLTWTPGAGTSADLTDIWLRTGAQSFAYATRLQVLNPGSTRYLIEGLTPGASYIASVQHRDPRSGDVSAAVDIAFGAGGITRVLSAPANPVAFSGSVSPESGVPNRDGVFGIAVLASEIPGFLEVQIAVETGVGSDVYGAFVTRAVAPAIASVQGNWTKAAFVAPNDGLRRQLQARHVADGAAPSAYTTPPVTVLPWTPLALVPLPTALLIVYTALDPSPPTDAGAFLRFQLAGVDPAGTVTQVALIKLSSNVTIVSGPALGVFAPNDTIWKIALPGLGTGPGTITAEAKTPDGRVADLMWMVPEAGISITVREQVTENGTTGTLTLVIDDPQAIVSKVSFYTQSGNDLPTGYVQDTTIPYGAQVTLAEGQISYIGYKVESTTHVLAENVVPFAIGAQPLALLETVLDPNGLVSARWTGDNNTQSVKIVGSTTHVPTVAEVRASTAINGRTGQTGTLATVAEGSMAWVSLLAYSQPSAAGLESILVSSQSTRPVAGTGTLPPGVQELAVEQPAGSVPMYGTLTVSLTDPQIRFRQFKSRTQLGNAAWTSQAVASSMPQSVLVGMVEGHISKIEYEIWTDMGSGTQLWYRGVVPFATGSIPIAPMIESSFGGTGNMTVTITGDSDTKSTRLGVSTVNQAAADSAAASATPINARVYQYVNVLVGVQSGTKCYVSAYAYPLINGGGTPSVIAQSVKDREGAGDKTPDGVISKVLRIHGAQFTSRPPANANEGLGYDGIEMLSASGSGAGPKKEWLAYFPVPPGVTITALRANFYNSITDIGGSVHKVTLLAILGNGSGQVVIAALNATINAGWSAPSTALSYGPTLDDPIMVNAEMLLNAAGQMRIAFVELTYTMPTYKQTI